MKVKVTGFYDGDSGYMSLPAPMWEGKEELNTGIWLTALYRGKKTGRMVARFYSQWVDHKGRITGEYFSRIFTSDWVNYCELAGIDPQVEAEEL
jgi:hypothetical protein